MADMARKNESLQDPVDDEGSVIRSRGGAGDSTRSSPPSSANSESAASAEGRRRSSARSPVPGSRDARIEQKLRMASALMNDLPSSDARVRLLHVAILRRDEALLDGVLAELNKLPSGR